MLLLEPHCEVVIELDYHCLDYVMAAVNSQQKFEHAEHEHRLTENHLDFLKFQPRRRAITISGLPFQC